MANIGSLTASLQLESAAFIRDLTKASQATAQASTRMQVQRERRRRATFSHPRWVTKAERLRLNWLD
jgi:hypothetical protein